MENGVYSLISKTDEIEYIIEVSSDNETEDNSKYTLKTSNNSNWKESFRNVTLIDVIDTGNGFVINTHEFELENHEHYDYSRFEYLCLILNFISKYETSFINEFKICKITEI